MVTLVTVTKPFRGHIGTIQRNALASWRALLPDAQILVFGDAPGAREAAAAVDAEHFPQMAPGPQGAPLLNDLLGRATLAAHHELMVLVNADIIFLAALRDALALLATRRFLMIGRCRDVEVQERLSFDTPTDQVELQRRWHAGRCRGPFAMDYFIFSRGLFGTLPPFAFGRVRYDNWLVWRALDLRVPVIDASDQIPALHQTHDYGHLAGGRREAWTGPDARTNRRLAGWGRYLHLHGIYDCTHTLGPTGLRARPHRRRAFARQLMARFALVASGR